MSEETPPTIVLVVANETLEGDELIQAVQRRAAKDRSAQSWQPP